MAVRAPKPKKLVSIPAKPFEPPHDKTNKMACAPSEDSVQSDQSLRCLHEESLGLSYPLSAQRRL